MIQYKPNLIMLIGGLQIQNETKNLSTTWIIDISNGFEITEGPILNHGRISHSCGKLKDSYGNVLLIVAGGGHNSSEILNTTLMKEWVKG